MQMYFLAALYYIEVLFGGDVHFHDIHTQTLCGMALNSFTCLGLSSQDMFKLMRLLLLLSDMMVGQMQMLDVHFYLSFLVILAL